MSTIDNEVLQISYAQLRVMTCAHVVNTTFVQKFFFPVTDKTLVYEQKMNESSYKHMLYSRPVHWIVGTCFLVRTELQSFLLLGRCFFLMISICDFWRSNMIAIDIEYVSIRESFLWKYAMFFSVFFFFFFFRVIHRGIIFARRYSTVWLELFFFKRPCVSPNNCNFTYPGGDVT